MYILSLRSETRRTAPVERKVVFDTSPQLSRVSLFTCDDIERKNDLIGSANNCQQIRFLNETLYVLVQSHVINVSVTNVKIYDNLSC